MLSDSCSSRIRPCSVVQGTFSHKLIEVIWNKMANPPPPPPVLPPSVLQAPSDPWADGTRRDPWAAAADLLTTDGSPTQTDPWADGALPEMLTTGGSSYCSFCGIPGHHQLCSRYVKQQHDPKQSRACQSAAAIWLGNESEVRFDTGAQQEATIVNLAATPLSTPRNDSKEVGELPLQDDHHDDHPKSDLSALDTKPEPPVEEF